MVYSLGFTEPGAKYPSLEFVDFDFTEARLHPDSTIKNAQFVTGAAAFMVGEAIDPNYVPSTLRWSSRRPPYDYITLHGSSIISPQMKEIVESLERGVHQFFPLKVVGEAGEHIADRWMWVVCSLIDSVDRECSTFELRNNMRWRASIIENPRLVFSAAQIGNKRFWRDCHLDLGNLQCSDDAASALGNAHLMGLALGFEEAN